MKANSGLKKNRTKIQMVLTALVILSVVRQFFLGNYHNMFLGLVAEFSAGFQTKEFFI